MGRKRLTEEQIIERYGSKEQYEKHLESMQEWYRNHPDRNKQYYRQNRRREIERTLKYRDAHQNITRNRNRERTIRFTTIQRQEQETS